MKHIHNITTLLLAMTLALLLSACNTKTSQDETHTAGSSSPTTQTTEDTSATGSGAVTGGATQNGGATATNSGTTTSSGGSSNATGGSNNNATNSNTNTNTGSNNSTTGGDGHTGTGTESNSTQTDANTTTGGEETNTTTDDNNSTDTNTTTPTVTLKSLNLRVNKTSLNKDENTTVKVVATYSDNTTKEVTDKVEWVVVPSDAAKMTNTTLTALQDKATTLNAKLKGKTSNAIDLNITWIVNGHTLPPEPDPQVNNATLLGVDVNDNGVRDDVERKVYTTYKKAVERAVMMQAFKTEQAMLADSDFIKNAREWEKKIWKAINCNDYLSTNRNTKPMSRQDVKNTTEWQINTEKRVKKYYKYDQALSGGVYSINDGILQDCEFDVEKVLEMDR